MRARAKGGWLAVLIVTLALAFALAPRKDAFEALGLPKADPAGPSYRREWWLRGSPDVERRRVEAVLARDGGWRFVGRDLLKNRGATTDLFYLYQRDMGDGQVGLQVHLGRAPGDRVFLVVDRISGWEVLRRRFTLWRRRLGV